MRRRSKLRNLNFSRRNNHSQGCKIQRKRGFLLLHWRIRKRRRKESLKSCLWRLDYRGNQDRHPAGQNLEDAWVRKNSHSRKRVASLWGAVGCLQMIPTQLKIIFKIIIYLQISQALCHCDCTAITIIIMSWLVQRLCSRRGGGAGRARQHGQPHPSPSDNEEEDDDGDDNDDDDEEEDDEQVNR